MPEPKYFQNFPKIELTIDGVDRTITDISTFIQAESYVLNSALPFYDYVVVDGERPDHVAFKHYGDSKFYWIILVTNNIRDVWKEWPMDDRTMRNFIIDKYGSVQTAKDQILKYFNTTDGIEIDYETYLATPESERAVQSAFDYEQEVNEAKRNIKLIQKRYIPQVQTELKELFV